MSRPDYRDKITFLSPPTTKDSYGGPSGTWTKFKADVWSSIEPILGNEYFSARAIQTDVTVKFRCHWFSGVLKTMRIQYGTELYEIADAIDVKNLNRELLCYCKKVSA